jgi:hypothetical protein
MMKHIETWIKKVFLEPLQETVCFWPTSNSWSIQENGYVWNQDVPLCFHVHCMWSYEALRSDSTQSSKEVVRIVKSSSRQQKL